MESSMPYFDEFADAVKSFGGPVMISIDHEMNGTWYAYSQSFPNSGTTAENYKAAWRHIVGIFRARGASNAGLGVVANVPDVGGIKAAAYLSRRRRGGLGWAVVYSGNPINNLRDFYAEWAARKPIFITEWATAPEQSQYYPGFPGDAPWVRSFFKALETTYPRVKGISWFQWNQADGNFLLQRVPEQAQSYAASVQKPRYIDQANPTAGSTTPARAPIIPVGNEIVLNEGARAKRAPLERVKTERGTQQRVRVERVRTENIRVER
jgi:hypothetical protein